MEANILDEGLIEVEVKLVPASSGKRLTNYIIDQIVITLFAFGFFFALELSLSLGFAEINPIADRILGMLFAAIAYIVLEGSLKGKTVGKYITHTRAVVRDTGAVPDLSTIIKRSFCRIVPFEAFSFLSDVNNGWHDKWSDTMVIDEKLSILPDNNVWIEEY